MKHSFLIFLWLGLPIAALKINRHDHGNGEAHFNVFHNVCVEVGEDDRSFIYTSPKTSIEPAPQAEFGTWGSKKYKGGMLWNAPGKQMSQAEWDQASSSLEPPTMVFSIPMNPNHAFYDGLLSLYPTFDSDDPFKQVWLPHDPDCKSHGCIWTQAFYDLKGKQISSANFLNAKSRKCFETIYVPRLSYYRPRYKGTLGLVPSQNISAMMRDKLTSKFGSSPAKYVLLYGHEDGNARRWNNIGEVDTALQSKGHTTRYLKGFAGLTVADQCETVWNADVIVMPHGGQEGNLVCARAGTKIFSSSCDPNVEWIRHADDFRKAMEFDYKFENPASCKTHQGRENFLIPLEKVEAFIAK